MKPLLFVSWLFGAYLIKLVDSACQRQFSLYIIPVYVQVVWYTEADGTKTALLMAKDPNTYKTDLQTPRIIRQYKLCSSSGQSSNCVLLCSVANAPDATLTMYKGDTAYSVNKYADLNIDLSLCLEVENQDKNNYSCVISNPTINKTTHLDIGRDCQECKDTSQTPMPVMEGDSVTLPTNITNVQDCHLMWMFECVNGELTQIAEIVQMGGTVRDCEKLRPRDRLQLDSQTGDLRIKNTSKEDAGVYKLLVNGVNVSDSKCWSFNVSVHDPLPSLQISNHSNHCPSSGSDCVLECSVENLTNGNLSWYKENCLLSSVSVSDLNYLCLDLENKDNGNYSCVISNSFFSKAKYVIISELCAVQSNSLILEIGLPVSLGLLALIVGLCYYYIKRKRARQEETRSQTTVTATSQNSPAVASGTAHRQTEDFNTEQQPLIGSSSTVTSQSIPLCCK